MATVDELLAEIAAFCAEAGISEATFATRAVNDGKFVGRLREGAGVTVKTVDRVYAYIAAERARRVRADAPAIAQETEVAAAPAAPFPGVARTSGGRTAKAAA